MHAGAISAAMNTSGQVGGILCPIVYAVLTKNAGSSGTALLLTAALYAMGAACRWFVHPEKPLQTTTA
jgi:hypothetical protein